MKIAYGLIRISKNSKETLEYLEKMDIPKESIFIEDFDGNSSVCRNKLIQQAKSIGADKLFILEDNIVPTSTDIFKEYIELMQEYRLKVIFYGFHGKNRILGKANPCIIVKVKEGREEFINRYSCQSFMLIDLEGNYEIFNERLNAAAFDEYLFRMHMIGYLPFYGFFFDIPNSWTKFRLSKDSTILNYPIEIINKDKEILTELKIEIKQQMNADVLTAFLKKKWYNI